LPGAGPAELGAALAGWHRTLVVRGPGDAVSIVDPATASARSRPEADAVLCLAGPADAAAVGSASSNLLLWGTRFQGRKAVVRRIPSVRRVFASPAFSQLRPSLGNKFTRSDQYQWALWLLVTEA